MIIVNISAFVTTSVMLEYYIITIEWNGAFNMKLTILGTGNAAVSECYNTCFAISDEGRHFLVDAGGGNRILKVLKDTGIEITDIHDIFVTHEHVDHVLGIIWLIRIIGQRMNQGKYDGELRIYCHKELSEKIQAIANMTIQQKVCKHMGERIRFDIVESGDQREVLDCPVTFFDIASTKGKTIWVHYAVEKWQKVHLRRRRAI